MRGSRPPSPGVGTRTGTRRAPLPRRQVRCASSSRLSCPDAPTAPWGEKTPCSRRCRAKVVRTSGGHLTREGRFLFPGGETVMVDALGDGLGVGHLRLLEGLPPLPRDSWGMVVSWVRKWKGPWLGPLTEAFPFQACPPEDFCLQPPLLSQALSEHAACGHEEPRPGTAGLAAVPLAG